MKLLHVIFIGGLAMVSARPGNMPAAHVTPSTEQAESLSAFVARALEVKANYDAAVAKDEGDRTWWDNAYIQLHDDWHADLAAKALAAANFEGYAKDFNKVMTALKKFFQAYEKAYNNAAGKIDDQTAMAAKGQDIADKLQAAADKAAALAQSVTDKHTAAGQKHAAWLEQQTAKLADLSANFAAKEQNLADKQQLAGEKQTAAAEKKAAHVQLQADKKTAADEKAAAHAQNASDKAAAQTANMSAKDAATAAKNAKKAANLAAKQQKQQDAIQAAADKNAAKQLSAGR